MTAPEEVKKHLAKWSEDSLDQSIEWANRAEHLRQEEQVGACLIADSISIMLRCFHNATKDSMR